MKRFFAIFFFIFSIVTVIILLTKNRFNKNYQNSNTDIGGNDESDEDIDSLVHFKKSLANAREKIQQIVDNPEDLSERQKQILDFITDQGEATMQSIAAYLKSVTPRTLRRDLQKLIESERIAKLGTTRNSSYKIQK